MALIRWWKLDGNVADSSTTGDHGHNTGVTFSPAYGLLSKGANFTGDGNTEINFQEITLTTHHTICFWMYGNTATPGGATDSMILGSYGDDIYDWMYAADSLRFRINDGSASYTWDTTTPGAEFPVNYYHVWHHVAVVFSASTMELFIDGISYGTRSYDGTFVFGNLGHPYNSTSFDYTGYLNDVRIYDHKLSNREIQEISRGKVLHLPFDYNYKSRDVYNGYDVESISGTPKIVHGAKKTGVASLDTSTSSSDELDYGDLNMPNPDCTITFWVYANTVDTRRNIMGKAYGGEGNLVVETNGGISFFWGTSGTDSTPWVRSLTDASMITAGTWIHVAVVRDYSNQVDTWYKNGVSFGHTPPSSWYLPTKGTDPLTIGNGYLTNFDGYIDDFRIYHRPLTEDECVEIYQTGAQIDRSGNLFADTINETSPYPLTDRVLDYSVWDIGTGSVSPYTRNGDIAENSRYIAPDPWGRDTIIWEAIPTAVSGADGGWYTSYFSIDNTKLYRYSVWVRRTVLGSSGRFFLGCRGNSTSDGVIALDDETEVANAYFWSSSTSPTTSELPDEWILVVGHIFPWYHQHSIIRHTDTGRWYLE